MLTLPSRSVRTSAAPQRGARGRSTRRGGHTRCGARLDRRQPRSQALQQGGQPRIGAAVVGDLEDVDLPEVEPAEDVGFGVGRQQRAHPAGIGFGDDRALVGVLARVGRAARAGRPQHAQRDGADAQHLAGARGHHPHTATRGLRSHPQAAGIADAVAAVETRATGSAPITAAAPPSWSACAWVTTSTSSRRTPAWRSRVGWARRAGPCRRGSRCAATGSAWRPPGRHRGR